MAHTPAMLAVLPLNYNSNPGVNDYFYRGCPMLIPWSGLCPPLRHCLLTPGLQRQPKLRNVSLELRNISFRLRNVSLELRNVSLELRNVSFGHTHTHLQARAPAHEPPQLLVCTPPPTVSTRVTYLQVANPAPSCLSARVNCARRHMTCY